MERLTYYPILEEVLRRQKKITDKFHETGEELEFHEDLFLNFFNLNVAQAICADFGAEDAKRIAKLILAILE